MLGIIWKCSICEDVKVSFAREHHTMDNCECGACGLDLEEYMTRILGHDVLFLASFDDNEYPFGMELYNDCLIQGFDYWDWLEIMAPLKRELYKDKYLNHKVYKGNFLGGVRW